MYPATTRPLAGVLNILGLVLPAFGVSRACRQRNEREARLALTVERPVDQVFACFARYTSWPRFMRHLYRVEEIGFGLSRWQAAGPAGLAIAWTARVTRYIPNELIAWSTEARSSLAFTGSTRFEPAGPGRTRVLVRLSYHLPGGRLGWFIAWLFGADPESILDEELARAKQWIEQEEEQQR